MLGRPGPMVRMGGYVGHMWRTFRILRRGGESRLAATVIVVSSTVTDVKNFLRR
jgi:hypothetical protein